MTTTMHRRSVVSGAAALAALSALPGSLVAELNPMGLTADERRLMSVLPADTDAEGRALILGMLRDPNPQMREITRYIVQTPRDQLVFTWDAIEAIEEGRSRFPDGPAD